MANVRKGNLTAPGEWWTHLRHLKRVFWKGERQAQKQAMPGRLEDDYTHDEFMADICTVDDPCHQCVSASRVCCDD